MLKDHIDPDKLLSDLRNYIAGTGPLPPIATWRLAKAGDVCGGCGRALRPGSFVQEALADGSIGHVECHMGGKPLRVTRLRAR